MLFVGDDWAEDHHDVCLQDGAGRVLAARRLPEGVAGIARLHELVAGHLDGDDPGQVVLAIETDRGPWVRALVAAGYRVFAVNPKQAARHREVVAVSGKKDDTFDAAALADMARTRRHQLREIAADSDEAEAVKVAARAHQKLVWERTRHALRMRSALREYFPAALEAYAELTLTGPDTLELLAKAPDPAAAARLTIPQISAALKRARRRDVAGKAQRIQAALREQHLGQSEVVTEAYAASVTAAAAVIAVLNEQIKTMEARVESLFRRHPDAGTYLSQPGIGVITGARMLGALRRRARPVRRRQSAPQLRQHLAADHRLRQEEDRARPVHPQRPPGQRDARPGVRGDQRIAGRPGLLRRAQSTRHRPHRRAAPPRQPPGRHPARQIGRAHV